ncbi:acyl-CoA dehydrogenase family protein [Saprospira grandis]|uniref:Acyl-CoA dehydrogenase n=1 Tax=Saprospira grandis (strain Lewin) TaxID=984262 RepID=H6L3K4_SAPGL|nr:acyl-CoA dehydrogenase family protein [Saprospira grandis]AFC24952.1 acyl-CoA dehydrogenase [Saprospira grandis str. Lewin]
MATTTSKKVLGGGEFLLEQISYENIFTKEERTEEQNMVLNMLQDFIDKEVAPNTAKIEKLDIELTKELLKKAGDLGLLGTSFPEEYGGFMQDFSTNMAITEYLAHTRSFSLSVGAHTGIGMLPILYFGNEEQKSKYLPSLVAGDKFAAYCLTEPDSGSDALAAKTKAVLNEAGTHYILNGQKMWITNAGFADVFVVFAKIDGEKFTGFIVEKAWEGVSLGAEEMKLGIKGSSTRQVFFENVEVPVENVLGQIGKGHKIAFNILNIGRIKLAAGVLGASKSVVKHAVGYANERKQFGQSIGNFGAIKHKLGEQATRIWVTEAAVHRASKAIDHVEHQLQAEGKTLAESLLGAAEEYAIECAILKVRGSECLDYVVDEGLQIYGGMGYSEEAPMASAYRDSRINRIFEGTNEINRMLSVDMLLKKAMKGQIDMMTPAMAIQKELMSFSLQKAAPEGLLAAELLQVQNLKKCFLAVSGMTAQELMMGLKDEQEILMNMADVMAEIYLAESAILRAQKLASLRGEEAVADQIAMSRIYLNDATERIAFSARQAVASWADGDKKKTLMLAIKRYCKQEFINTKALRRQIADSLLAANDYCYQD